MAQKPLIAAQIASMMVQILSKGVQKTSIMAWAILSLMDQQWFKQYSGGTNTINCNGSNTKLMIEKQWPNH